jgi:predicted neuraminidase
VGSSAAAPAKAGPTLVQVKSEFIFEKAPFPSCHASTLAETKTGLIAAWFGGTAEKNPDVGIWISRTDGEEWSAPVQVATGLQKDGRNRFPCWNPVLFQPARGPLLLFFKVGPSPSRWWGMLTRSEDGGKSWSAPQKLPEGILGPIKNKPVESPLGGLICPSSTEDNGWKVHVERTSDLGLTWTKTGPLNNGKKFEAIQPTVLLPGGNRILLLCRSQQKCITECRSEDGGATWSPMRATDLPNPNSGIDAVTLKEGWFALVYNHTVRGRSPLNVALSNDGEHWEPALVLESLPGEYSYPAVIQARDGRIHVTYTWKRQKIKHAILEARF